MDDVMPFNSDRMNARQERSHISRMSRGSRFHIGSTLDEIAIDTLWAIGFIRRNKYDGYVTVTQAALINHFIEQNNIKDAFTETTLYGERITNLDTLEKICEVYIL